jgi:hypothetical protein
MLRDVCVLVVASNDSIIGSYEYHSLIIFFLKISGEVDPVIDPLLIEIFLSEEISQFLLSKMGLDHLCFSYGDDVGLLEEFTSDEVVEIIGYAVPDS